MNDYNIKELYEEMEMHLIKSMQRNLSGHLKEEEAVGFEYPQWQAIKLKELKKYQRENQSIIKKYTHGLNKDVSNHLQNELRQGSIQAIKEYNKVHKNKLNADKMMTKSFFKTNQRKVNNLIKVVNNDLNSVNTSALRMMNDQYRQIIHKSAFFVGNGVMTEKQATEMAIAEISEKKATMQAVDEASKNFLSGGLNCVEYKDGRRVNIASYSEMAVRTASLRAHLMGEGDFRKSIGRSLVQVTTHGESCDGCANWEGKILIDDVYSGGKPDGEHTLLSEAMAQGLFHPNCRHGLTTYYPELEGISYDTPEDDIQEELQDKINYYDRQEKRFIRLHNGSIDPDNRKIYKSKKLAYESRKSSLIVSTKTDDDVYYEDITNQWMGNVPSQPYKVKMYSKNETYMYKNHKYKFDGHYVKYMFDEGEDDFADWLSKLIDKKITLMPKIEYPQEIKSADFRIGNQYYDLKTVHGKDKQIIYHKIYGKKEQAKRFFFDIADDSSLTMDDLIKQANELFMSNKEDRNWVEMIGIRQKNKFIMLKRK